MPFSINISDNYKIIIIYKLTEYRTCDVCTILGTTETLLLYIFTYDNNDNRRLAEVTVTATLI